MKRHAIALTIRPCKNQLVAEKQLRFALDTFAEKFLSLCSSVTPLTFNLVLPAYFFRYIDPILLAGLRELHKSDRLEWQTTGYTEPFASFSPPWLTDENLKAGLEVFDEFAAHPMGYAPPFSNWEPSMVCSLHSLGFQYTVLSRAILPRHLRQLCGYWITEYAGIPFPVFPSVVLDPESVPVNLEHFISDQLSKQPDIEIRNTKILTLEYILSLTSETLADQFEWLTSVAVDLERLVPKYQTVRLSDCQSLTPSLGLLSIPAGIRSPLREQDNTLFFRNDLHTFDQVGILQRKMISIADQIHSMHDRRERNELLNKLFFAQDINRYLLKQKGGFRFIRDRLWSYHNMINIERRLVKKQHSKGGHIKITNFLRDGTKSIILGNQALRAFIDHNGGGQIFELDYFGRAVNLCAAYNYNRHIIPKILVAGKSPSSFIDYICLPTPPNNQCVDDILKQQVGDFYNGHFDYMISKNANSVKVILNRRGIAHLEDKPRPLRMEKVFSLEEDKPAISFVYQLANPSLSSFSFTFVTAITLGLPGVESGETLLHIDKHDKHQLSDTPVCFENTSKWSVVDTQLGARLDFAVQKPITLHVLPSHSSENDFRTKAGYQGTRFLLCAPITLEENAVWSLMGKISFRRTEMKGRWQDAI
ncbi:MAG: alpha-amylase/4-alpha-glucanotransferase domain-containing protein [Chitinispirillaceae bacterium]